MLRSALNLFFLRELPWSSFSFPRWQTLLALALVGVAMGFAPSMRALLPDIAGMPALSLGIAVASSVLLTLICTPVIVGFLRWWMQRGGRWDGQGDMFNLLVASELMANILSAGLTLAGMPVLWMLPLLLYFAWVGGNALSGAIPKASLAYSTAGLVVTLIPALIVYTLLLGLISFALGVLGATSPLHG